MLRTILLFSLMLFTGVGAFPGSISGKLQDIGTKLPVEFARVMLIQPNNQIHASVSTKASGDFAFRQLADGSYRLKIVMAGYESIEIPVKIDRIHSDIQLGKIDMSAIQRNLKQVEVTGRKSQVRFEIDRKVYQVDQNITAAGSSATEILRTIPSVEIAPDGAVLLRNNPNVIIWINGRPSGLNEDNRSQILDQLPADAIEKVEIISNPSSKYSPDGSAGIINIVLRKTNKPGRSGSVSAGIDSNKGNNATVNYFSSSTRWDVSASAGYRYDNKNMIFNSDRWTYYPALSDTIVRYSRDKVLITSKGVFVRSAFSYHATANDDLSFSAMVSGTDRNVNEKIANERIGNYSHRKDYRYSDMPTKRKLYNFSIDYTHRFKRKGEELRAGIETNISPANSDQQVHQMDSVFATRYYQWSHTRATRKELTIQLDYTRPLAKNTKLECGYKGEFLKRNSVVKSEYATDLLQRIPQHALDNEFGGSDNRNSLYLNLSSGYKKLNFQLGLRAEYNHQNNHSVIYNQLAQDSTLVFNDRYPGLYPSLFLDYDLGAGNKLQLSYTRRINRPKGRMTNPFRNVADSANIEYGNPNLHPEYSHVVELSYLYSKDEHSLSSVLYCRTTNNVIQSVNYVGTEGSYDIKFMTMENITNSQSYGLDLMAKDRLWRIVDLTSSVNLFYNHLDGFEYKGTAYPLTSCLGWNGKIITNITLPWGVVSQVSAAYQSRRNIAQGSSLSVWGIDAGVRKSFMQKKLQVNLAVRDLFKSRLNRDITSGYNYYDYSEYRLNPRTCSLTISYNIGQSSKKQDKLKENENPFAAD